MPNGQRSETRPHTPQATWRPWLTVFLMVAVIWLLVDRYRYVIYDPDAEPRAIAPRGDLAATEQRTLH